MQDVVNDIRLKSIQHIFNIHSILTFISADHFLQKFRKGTTAGQEEAPEQGLVFLPCLIEGLQLCVGKERFDVFAVEEPVTFHLFQLEHPVTCGIHRFGIAAVRTGYLVEIVQFPCILPVNKEHVKYARICMTPIFTFPVILKILHRKILVTQLSFTGLNLFLQRLLSYRTIRLSKVFSVQGSQGLTVFTCVFTVRDKF